MKACPVCAAPSDGAYQTRYVHVRKCRSPHCGHLFAVGTGPRHGVMHETDSDDVARLYQQRNRGLVAFWRRRGFLCQCSRVLDVGAGTGHVAQSVRALLPDVRISCIEESEALAALLAQRGFEIASAQYREGIGSQLELTDAEVALRQSEFNYAQAVYDYLVFRAQLDEAVGQVPMVDQVVLP